MAVDTNALLDAALAKYNDARTKAEGLLEREQQLQQQYGRHMANGDKISALSVRAELDRVQRENYDLVAMLPALGADVAAARSAHRVTLAATLTPKFKDAAQSLSDQAQRFEEAVATLIAVRAAFVAAGTTLRALAFTAGDVEPGRFQVAKLADDIIGTRVRPLVDMTFNHNGAAYEKPIPTLVAPIVQTAEVIL
ncbi:MAG TPA: hypothetical protein VEM14_03310 [Gemmatimonadaceae bacterium]|nr:hypothetical protein [Gemmatimonadaceae bacterium]